MNEATLKRFFSLHYILGFAIGAFVFGHLIILHDKGSSSVNNENFSRKTNFLSLYGEEIFFTFYLLICIVAFVSCYRPNFSMHPANYEQANPLSTPPHIVPEWYFLPFYTILRIVPNKTYGVLLMGLSIVILFLVPFLGTHNFRKEKS